MTSGISRGMPSGEVPLPDCVWLCNALPIRQLVWLPRRFLFGKSCVHEVYRLSDCRTASAYRRAAFVMRQFVCPCLLLPFPVSAVPRCQAMRGCGSYRHSLLSRLSPFQLKVFQSRLSVFQCQPAVRVTADACTAIASDVLHRSPRHRASIRIRPLPVHKYLKSKSMQVVDLQRIWLGARKDRDACCASASR